MTLSDQQMAFFETFGYLTFPGVFAAEAEMITEEFERVGRATAAGTTGNRTIMSAARRWSRSSTRASI